MALSNPPHPGLLISNVMGRIEIDVTDLAKPYSLTDSAICLDKKHFSLLI